MSKRKQPKSKEEAFRESLNSFLIWGAALVFINLVWARGYFWSMWVIFFWGLSVLKQSLDVYGWPWEKKKRTQSDRPTAYKQLGDGSDAEPFEPPKTYSEEEIEERKWNEKDFL